MRITAECTIDLDKNRRVWVQVDTNVESDQLVAAAANALCAAAADGAMKAYDHAIARDPALGGSSASKEPDMSAMQGG